jgi:SAM-dependent methyltransferase
LAEAEFTGERVIPGRVDDDLWSEHVSRYAFAASLQSAGNALDIGCGAGYGTAILAAGSRSAAGVDIATDAIAYARGHYTLPNVRFAAASCLALPFASARFDLVVAFEVIEHLSEYRRMLDEAARVLAPGGVFVVSTPNRQYYSETRASVGPNPFHAHEFDATEFRAVLEERFSHVRLLTQNHSEAFLFSPREPGLAEARGRIETNDDKLEEAHFFVALCSREEKRAPAPFIFVPRAANLLRERDHQLQALETRLSEAQRSAAENISRLEAEIAERNQWAERLDDELKEAREKIERRERETAEMAAGYDAKIAAIEADLEQKTNWARETERRLMAEMAELHRSYQALLDEANATIEERTKWAQSEQKRREHLEAVIAMVQRSRWVKIARRLHVGPDLTQL